MTAEETAIHIVSELLENGHTQTGVRTKGVLSILQAIIEAKEEGRAEMREKCAQVAEAEECQMKKRMPASDVDAQYKDGYVDGAHACVGFIRALPTDSLAEVPSA